MICLKACDGCGTVCIGRPSHFPSRPHEISPILIIVVCAVGAAFVVVSYCAVLLKYYYSVWNRRRRSNPPVQVQNNTHEDFIDEEQSPVVYHPIWLINTVGLQQSVIDLITVTKYNKDEGLIDGTECSVCLSEFEEDESLRLLPKCSHAFHLPCIDTWLRSHKNCPLCRAPIIHESIGTNSDAVQQISDDSGSTEAMETDNLDVHSGSGSSEVGEGGAAEIRVRDWGVGESAVEGASSNDSNEILRKGFPYMNRRKHELRVLSDLAGNHRAGEEEIEPIRRSVSMDLSAASEIYLDIAKSLSAEHEGTSDTRSVPGNKLNLEIVSRRSGGNSSFYKLMKSSSIGCSLQMGPLSMKRSLSSIAKFSSRRSRSRNSILPL